MKKYYFLTLIVMLFSVYMGCKKDKEDENPTPPTYTNGVGEIDKIGGTIIVDDASSALNGVSVIIPENALSSTQNISINLAPSSIKFPGDASATYVEFEPSGLEFAEPVQIIMPFEENADTAKLKLYYYDQTNAKVVQIPSTINWANKTVIGYTNHFSIFLISENGVWAQVKYFYENSSQKLFANITVAGFSEQGQYLGLDGIPTNISDGQDGYRSVKWKIDETMPSHLTTVCIEVKLKKRRWPKWLSPTVETKTIWVELPYSYITSSTNLEVYDPNFDKFLHTFNISAVDFIQREEFSSGKAICLTFTESVNPSDKYFIDAEWSLGYVGDNGNNYIPAYTVVYEINDYDYALEPNNMLNSNIVDLNYNRILDNYDGYSPNNAPTAVLLVLPDEGTTNTNFQFDASASHDNSKSTKNIIKYEWDLDDNGYYDKTGINITNKFSTQGTYKVTLRVTDNGGLTNKTSKFVTVSNGATPPTADFIVSPSTGNTTTEFSFNASTSSNNAKYFRWDFNNDGNWDTQYTTSKTFTHKYNNHGNYIVKLEVKSSENLIGQKTKSVVVTEPGDLTIINPNSSTTWTAGQYNVPIDWETGELGGNVKLQVYKGNIKKGTITPDGTPNDGNYTGYSVQSSLAEGTDYRIKILSIEYPEKTDFSSFFTILQQDNLPPVPPFDPYPAHEEVISELNTLLFWSCNDPEEDPLTYDVYIEKNNPNPSYLLAGGITENSVNYENMEAGARYYWKVVAKDDHNNNTSSPVWWFETQSSGSVPIADFTSDITSGTPPLTVNFTDQSTNNPTTWQWDFGDGGTSTQPNPAHTYNTDDSYTVTLTVSNEYGNDTKTITNYIYVGSGGGGEPCPDTPTVTDADGNVYNTVQIGGQCWMKENLRVGTRIDGSQEMSSGNGIEKYCYDNDPDNCDTYGGLYQWNEMMQYTTTPGEQGICPDGWHLPSDEEWKTMEMTLGMSQGEADDLGLRGTDEGGKMKEAGTTHWNSPNTGATNSSGFTALPGGRRESSGSFYYLGNQDFWWSSSEYSGTSAWRRCLYHDHGQVYRGSGRKALGRSVRCLKN